MMASSALTSNVAEETVQAENDGFGDSTKHNKNIQARIDKPTPKAGLLETILALLKLIGTALIVGYPSRSTFKNPYYFI
jgi:hypothetical protein